MLPPRFLAALLRSTQTWLVVLLTVIALWQFNRWFAPPLLMLVAAVGLGALLLALWPMLLLRDGGFMAQLVRPAGEMNAADEVRLRALEAELMRLQAEQPLAQLRLLRAKLDKLATVLRHRLDAGELTYARYLGTSEQVYLAALDNLQEVALVLASRSADDDAYVSKRLREIEVDGVSEREQAEHATLTERRALADNQQRKVEAWLAENERAMTVLDNTAAALTDTRTREGMAAVSAEEAIRELEALASRTGRYAVRP